MARLVAQVNGVSSPPIIVNRPKWTDMIKSYPKNSDTEDMPASEVFTMIFGVNYSSSYTNACAARLSVALIKCKVNISSSIRGKIGEFKDKGVILGASNMKDWLSKTTVWGKPDIKIKQPITLSKVEDELNTKKGVYIMIPKLPKDFGATGHVTLWTGSRVIGHDYANEYAYEVLFWELK